MMRFTGLSEHKFIVAYYGIRKKEGDTGQMLQRLWVFVKRQEIEIFHLLQRVEEEKEIKKSAHELNLLLLFLFTCSRRRKKRNYWLSRCVRCSLFAIWNVRELIAWIAQMFFFRKRNKLDKRMYVTTRFCCWDWENWNSR